MLLIDTHFYLVSTRPSTTKPMPYKALASEILFGYQEKNSFERFQIFLNSGMGTLILNNSLRKIP